MYFYSHDMFRYFLTYLKYIRIKSQHFNKNLNTQQIYEIELSLFRERALTDPQRAPAPDHDNALDHPVGLLPELEAALNYL